MTEISNEPRCKSCGACCDGSLFIQAKLADNEDMLPRMRESFAQKQRGFALPCPYFSETCSVYDQRPKVCRIYSCALLEDYTCGAASFDEASQAITRLRQARTALTAVLPEAAQSVPAAEQAFAAGFRAYPDMMAFQAENRETIAAIKEMQEATRPFTKGRVRTDSM